MAAAAEMEANTAAAEPSVQDWLETIGPALETVRATVACSVEARSSGSPSDAVRLVAVSKTKPAAALVAAHQAGQRCGQQLQTPSACPSADYDAAVDDYPSALLAAPAPSVLTDVLLLHAPCIDTGYAVRCYPLNSLNPHNH